MYYNIFNKIKSGTIYIEGIQSSRIESFGFRWISFAARSPYSSLPSTIYFGRGVAKVNSVEKCVLKARVRLEKEREKKQGGVCGGDSLPIHHGCFISDASR